MAKCDGGLKRGDHCCWINGEECEFLLFEDGMARCALWSEDMKGLKSWQLAPVGRWFAETHPGFDCKDWPQNIPDEMEKGIGLCCWQEVTIN